MSFSRRHSSRVSVKKQAFGVETRNRYAFIQSFFFIFNSAHLSTLNNRNSELNNVVQIVLSDEDIRDSLGEGMLHHGPLRAISTDAG